MTQHVPHMLAVIGISTSSNNNKGGISVYFLTPKVIKWLHVFKSREASYTIPHLEFKFRFRLPNPRKERIIVERDEFGRIIRSEPPQLYLDYIPQKS